MIIPFPTAAGKGQEVVFRFAFDETISTEAQQMLAGMLARFAQSVQGVEATSFVLDAQAGEWVASMTLRDRIGPRAIAAPSQRAKLALGDE